MGKYVRDFLALGLPAIALGGGCVEDAQATGGDEEPRPKITLRVYNYARVPAPILVSAEGEAQKIFREVGDRKSTRLNSSHGYISYAVFCLKKKNFLF